MLVCHGIHSRCAERRQGKHQSRRKREGILLRIDPERHQRSERFTRKGRQKAFHAAHYGSVEDGFAQRSFALHDGLEPENKVAGKHRHVLVLFHYLLLRVGSVTLDKQEG